MLEPKTDEAQDRELVSERRETELVYLSPQELTARWRCFRTQVDRIAKEARFTRVVLGKKKNGIVRYLKKEVEAYERSRRVEA